MRLPHNRIQRIQHRAVQCQYLGISQLHIHITRRHLIVYTLELKLGI